MTKETFGYRVSLGSREYSVSGYHTLEDAILACYEMAYADGKWRPRELRKHWWQLWLPTRHTQLEEHFIREELKKPESDHEELSRLLKEVGDRLGEPVTPPFRIWLNPTYLTVHTSGPSPSSLEYWRASEVRELLLIAIKMCEDVTKLGHFSPTVDPVQWVQQLETYIRGIEHNFERFPPPPPPKDWDVKL